MNESEKLLKKRLSKQEKKQQKRERLKALHKEKRAKRPKKKRKNTHEQNPKTHTIAFDFYDENLMTEKEIKSLIYQINLCYSKNRIAKYPVFISFFNFTSFYKNLMDKNFDRWDIHISDLPQSQIVYLSPDAENYLETFDSSKIYVIGALIDRNRHKNVTRDRCKLNNYDCVKLPIDKYLKMNCSSVLTCNQVFDILSSFIVTNCWRTTFQENIPQRKILSWN